MKDDCVVVIIYFLELLDVYGVDLVWVVICGDSVGGIVVIVIS